VEKSLGLALVTLATSSSQVSVSAWKIGSVLEASQLDRWISLAWSQNSLFTTQECSFEPAGNLTCTHNTGAKILPGWPIIVRKKGESRRSFFERGVTKIDQRLGHTFRH